MPALLIIGGLLLLLVALLWLVQRAFARSLLWGCLSLLLPLSLLFVLRHWSRARAPVLLAGLAVIPLVTGLVMLAQHDPQRFESIISGHWLKPEAPSASALAINLHGVLNGRPFAPQHAELIDGVLRLREGQGFYAQRELLIRLGQRPTGALRLNVLPADEGQLPEVEISWLLPEQALPEARQLRRGYTLSLDLQPVAPNKWQGELHLALPAPYKTTLTGKLELFSNGLRYRAGEVDRQVDSMDTLHYVIADYLQRRFTTRQVLLQPLPTLNLQQWPLSVSVQALIKGQTQQLNLQMNKTAEQGWQVAQDHFADLRSAEVVGLNAQAAVPTVAQTQPTASARLDRRLGFSLAALQANPARYVNLRMRISSAGHSAEGQFQGVSADGRLQLRQRISGPGGVSYSFSAEQISHIELLEP